MTFLALFCLVSTSLRAQEPLKTPPVLVDRLPARIVSVDDALRVHPETNISVFQSPDGDGEIAIDLRLFKLRDLQESFAQRNHRVQYERRKSGTEEYLGILRRAYEQGSVPLLTRGPHSREIIREEKMLSSLENKILHLQRAIMQSNILAAQAIVRERQGYVLYFDDQYEKAQGKFTQAARLFHQAFLKLDPQYFEDLPSHRYRKGRFERLDTTEYQKEGGKIDSGYAVANGVNRTGLFLAEVGRTGAVAAATMATTVAAVAAIPVTLPLATVVAVAGGAIAGTAAGTGVAVVSNISRGLTETVVERKTLEEAIEDALDRTKDDSKLSATIALGTATGHVASSKFIVGGMSKGTAILRSAGISSATMALVNTTGTAMDSWEVSREYAKYSRESRLSLLPEEFQEVEKTTFYDDRGLSPLNVSKNLIIDMTEGAIAAPTGAYSGFARASARNLLTRILVTTGEVGVDLSVGLTAARLSYGNWGEEALKQEATIYVPILLGAQAPKNVLRKSRPETKVETKIRADDAITRPIPVVEIRLARFQGTQHQVNAQLRWIGAELAAKKNTQEIGKSLDNLEVLLARHEKELNELKRDGLTEQKIQSHIQSHMDVRQTASLQEFLQQFREGFDRRYGEAGITDSSARPSDRALAAVSMALSTSYASVDFVGAPNVQHLATVFDGALTARKNEIGYRSLTQNDLDLLLMETVLTDSFLKGRGPKETPNAPLAPLLDRKTREPIGRGHGITLGQEYWERALQKNPTLGKMEFIYGTSGHGLMHYDLLDPYVQSAGGTPRLARRIYAAHLGHHPSHYPARFIAQTDVIPDFDTMVDLRHLDPEVADGLSRQWEASLELADHWGARLTTPGVDPTLTKAERDRYYADAAPLRRVIHDENFPDYIRDQLISDDTQQFTRIGIPKWIYMMNGIIKPKTNAELLTNVYGGAAQAYLEANIARGTGIEFETGTAKAAEILGIFLEENPSAGAEEHPSRYRLAEPREKAYTEFAQALFKDPGTAQAAAQHFGVSYESFRPSSERMREQMVEWFRSQPADPVTLSRIAEQE